MPSKMDVASQHCDTVPNKTKDILDFRLKKKKLHDSRAQLPVQSRVDQNIKKFLEFHSHLLYVVFICQKCPFSGSRKWDFACPNPKTETTFSRQHPPKMVE